MTRGAIGPREFAVIMIGTGIVAMILATIGHRRSMLAPPMSTVVNSAKSRPAQLSRPDVTSHNRGYRYRLSRRQCHAVRRLRNEISDGRRLRHVDRVTAPDLDDG